MTSWLTESCCMLASLWQSGFSIRAISVGFVNKIVMGKFGLFQFALSTHYSNTATCSPLTIQGVYSSMLALSSNLGLQSDMIFAWTHGVWKFVLFPVNAFFNGKKKCSNICEIKQTETHFCLTFLAQIKVPLQHKFIHVCIYYIFNCLYLTLLCGYKMSRFKLWHIKSINNHILNK
jgi:hypothetical protein